MLTPEQIKTLDRIDAVTKATRQEGAIVERRNRNSTDEWNLATDPFWNFGLQHYRVRLPGTPTRRPLCQEDFWGHAVILFREKGNHSKCYGGAVSGVITTHFTVFIYDYLLNNEWEWSIDLVTWNLFYVETLSPETIISTE